MGIENGSASGILSCCFTHHHFTLMWKEMRFNYVVFITCFKDVWGKWRNISTRCPARIPACVINLCPSWGDIWWDTCWTLSIEFLEIFYILRIVLASHTKLSNIHPFDKITPFLYRLFFLSFDIFSFETDVTRFITSTYP